MLRDVYLHGEAGRRFGKHHRLDVATPAEAVRALITMEPQLRPYLRQGEWRLIVGTPRLRNAIELPALNMELGSQPFHIVAAHRARGGDEASIGKIIVGAILIGAVLAFAPIGAIGFAGAMGAGAFGGMAFGMTYGAVALLGVSMLAGGVSGLLASSPGPQQEATQLARAEDRPSFMFNGVTNNTQQGGPVPVVIGRHLVGSTVVSGSLTAEDIAP